MGQNVVGQDVSGAERRRAELCGAGRHWGNILGAKRRGAEGSGAGSVSPKISINIPDIFVFVGTNE